MMIYLHDNFSVRMARGAWNWQPGWLIGNVGSFFAVVRTPFLHGYAQSVTHGSVLWHERWKGSLYVYCRRRAELLCNEAAGADDWTIHLSNVPSAVGQAYYDSHTEMNTAVPRVKTIHTDHPIYGNSAHCDVRCVCTCELRK